MKKYSLIFFTFTIGILTSCSSGYRELMVVNDSNNDSIIDFFDRGQNVIVSIKDSTVVAFHGNVEKRRLYLDLFIENFSSDLIQFNPADISVIGSSIKLGPQVVVTRNEFGTSYETLHDAPLDEYLRVFTAGELIGEVKRTANWHSTMTFFNGLVRSIEAGTTTTTTSGSTTGDLNYSFYSRSVTHTPQAAHQVQDETSRQLADIRQNRDSSISNLMSNLLMRHTLFPNTYVDGLLVVDFVKHENYVLQVRLGDVFHEIEFNLIDKYQ